MIWYILTVYLMETIVNVFVLIAIASFAQKMEVREQEWFITLHMSVAQIVLELLNRPYTKWQKM